MPDELTVSHMGCDYGFDRVRGRGGAGGRVPWLLAGPDAGRASACACVCARHVWPARSLARVQVFDPEASQGAVFEDTKQLIQSAVDGYNVCVFAYGQVRACSHLVPPLCVGARSAPHTHHTSAHTHA